MLNNEKSNQDEISEPPNVDVTHWPKRISRFTAAGHLLGNSLAPARWVSVSNQIWTRSLIHSHCDVVLSFPRGTSEAFIFWFKTELVIQVPQLILETKFHKYSRNWCFYVTSTDENFLKGAEEMHLKKPLKIEYGGGLKEFIKEDRDCYEGAEKVKLFLTSMERQSIIQYYLNNLKASKTDGRILKVHLQEGQSVVPKCLAQNKIHQLYPLHDINALQSLKQNWVQAFCKVQPLDDICNYFGVKIAIYFAWLGHYTKALILPSLFGFAIWILGYGHDKETEDKAFVMFALFNVLWATLYLECWKRACAELAYHWGTLDVVNELLVKPRPLFMAPITVSPITGKMEPYYHPWKRNLFRYLVSLPVMTICLSIVVFTMFSLLQLQDYWDKWLDLNGYPGWLKSFPKILTALVITLLDALYSRIAYWLNDMENYRLEEEYENHLIVKIAVFQFVNSFLSLFYIAFYLRDMDRLKEQLAALLITRQIFGNVKESILPFLFETLKLSHLSINRKELEDPEITNERKSEKLLPVQAEVEGALYAYDGTFEDYLEMFIQFGYVVLFSSAFPLAALFALLNNVIEIRSDAFKLCVIFQRPFGAKAKNIGAWQNAMEMMGIIAVIVNCALIGLSGHVERTFPDLTPAQITLLIVVLEHIILIAKLGLAHAIPDVPTWVATEIAKIEYRRHEAAKVIHRTELLQRKDGFKEIREKI